jgi:hypothetical protein
VPRWWWWWWKARPSDLFVRETIAMIFIGILASMQPLACSERPFGRYTFVDYFETQSGRIMFLEAGLSLEEQP